MGKKTLLFLYVAILAIFGSQASAQITVITSGSGWEATDSAQGTGWNTTTGTWHDTSVIQTTLIGSNGQPYNYDSLVGYAMWTDTSRSQGVPGIGDNDDMPVYFRRKFTLSSATIDSVTISLFADDITALYLNGYPIDTVSYGNVSLPNLRLTPTQIQQYLVPGENIVAIVGENLSPDIWYVYFKMYIEQSDLSGIADIAQNNTVNVYPNPVRGNLLAEINNAGSDGSAYIEVLDMSGRTLLAKDINGLSQGRNTYSLSVSDLSAGAYLIRVTIGGISVFNRFEVIGSH